MSSERGLTHDVTWWVLPSDSSGRREKLKSTDLGSQRCNHTESTGPGNVGGLNGQGREGLGEPLGTSLCQFIPNGCQPLRSPTSACLSFLPLFLSWPVA